MIEYLELCDTATYGTAPEQLGNLSKFNFLFGTNGTGKTTISRVIADATLYPRCKLVWKDGRQLQTVVYNRDFIDNNFTQSEEFKGVFTLGEKNADTLATLANAKKEVDELTEKLRKLNHTLVGDSGTGGKRGELDFLEAELKDKCWAQKVKHDTTFRDAFDGVRSSRDNFKAKVLSENQSNEAALLDLAELATKAKIIFGTPPVSEPVLPTLQTDDLLAYETNPILSKCVIGKDDVDISAMIQKLGNSDWVREGRAFFSGSDGNCPFCQQATSKAFKQSLEEYFDEAFEADTLSISTVLSDYIANAERVQSHVDGILCSPGGLLDVAKLKLEKDLLDSRIKLNVERLEGKRKEPSQVISLEPLSDVVSAISVLIDQSNIAIAAHNLTVTNFVQERATLVSQVWKFVTGTELKADLLSYSTRRAGIVKAIDSLNSQADTLKLQLASKAKEIKELEKQITSIQPTINGINGLLKSFGFRGFELAQAIGNSNYKLIRSDGTDAKATLSEGEKTFVTFLYFYHLLKGSDSETGISVDRVVVFDDPVSSLDSDILFIVGSLIKSLFDEVRKGVGHLKQIFILTHNVYFHKEVTYNSNRKDVAMNEETFWIVRKSAASSKIESHPSNPIKTSYELLWSEIRAVPRSNHTIQNTLRRILENYFKILGGIDTDNICEMFDGKEKIVCKSLFSWVNDGSHYAHDDIFVAIDDAMVDTYLTVFKAIFDKSKHSAHYEMMMRI